ncbi:MAG: TonB-dependent receptor [Gammaproteobacteria bacterium]
MLRVNRRRLTILCAMSCVPLGRGYAQSHMAPAAEPLSAPIISESLSQALGEFIALTHLQLVYVSRLALGKTSQPVPAGPPAAESLSQLLQGTGLLAVFLNDHTVELLERPREQRDSEVDAAALQEVVVTANKRSEILRTVPMSISVFSSADMEIAGIKDIGGISAATTGVDYDFSSQYGPGILTNFAIRGISSNIGDATTGIYIDDTPIQSGHTSLGNAFPLAFDMERVEVLRGPQGVLFGRSAEGGAIRFITNEASTTSTSLLTHSEIALTDDGGTSDELGAALGGPLIDGELGARVSAWYRIDGGYVNRDDPFTGTIVESNANHSDSEALKIGLAYEPSDTLRIVPSLSYQSVKLHDSPVFYVGASQAQAGRLDSGKLLRQPSVDSFTLGSVQFTQALSGADLTAITSYFDRAARTTVDSTNAAGVDFYGGFGNPLGPAFPTSYAQAVPTLLRLHQIQLSEEVRLASPHPAARLTWMGGLFVSKWHQDSFQDTFAIAAPTVAGILESIEAHYTEISAFGQIRWLFTDAISLGTGVRVGQNNSGGTDRDRGIANPEAIPITQTRGHETLPATPRFDLSYQPNSLSFFYAAITKGFRTGGSNGTLHVRCTGSADPASFAPDEVWSYELGSKSQLFDHRVQLNASIYDIHWNNIQETVDDACGNEYITNSGAARSRGFDLDVDAAVANRLRVSLAIGLVDVRYTRTVTNANSQVVVDQGTVVGGVPSVPAPWSGIVSARYDWPFGAWTTYLRAENIAHSHNTGPFSEHDPKSINPSPRARADPATNIVNMQLGLHRSCMDVRVFVNNALNDLPLLRGNADAPASALVYAHTVRPRTVGISGTCVF